MKRFSFLALFKILTLISVFFVFQSCDFPLRGYFSSVRVSVNDDYSEVVKNPDYSAPVHINGIEMFTQEVSCGYAVLQMLAQWQGKDLTEEKLYEMNNHTVSTSVGDGFIKEISKQFPEWNVTRYVNCSNSDLLKMSYETLKSGYPVPFEWAAKDVDENWTLHFSLIIGMDLKNDKVEIANPYGYFEECPVDDFIRATRYEAYENMEWVLEAGFNIGLFNQNTIYVIVPKK